jgi:phosphoribosyl 1,2-cyclic phosphodiesterase
MIREHGTKDVFYVIDVNYFPGKYNLFLFISLVILCSKTTVPFCISGHSHVEFATKLAVITCFAKLAEHSAL